MTTIVQIMRMKAGGENNAVGYLWGDHNCAIAADTIDALVAALDGLMEECDGRGPKYYAARSGADAALALARKGE